MRRNGNLLNLKLLGRSQVLSPDVGGQGRYLLFVSRDRRFKKKRQDAQTSAPASRACPTTSEHNLQAKLNLARDTDNARDRAHGCARKDRRIGQIELRGIKDVEELGAELHFHLLGNWEVLEQ